MSLRDIIAQRIQSHGPLPFAEYMDLALYQPEFGYYARVDRRSGPTGDFFTSVDLGTLFGELLAKQFAEMWEIVGTHLGGDAPPLTLVEAGAGNGRLAADLLEASQARHSEVYSQTRLILVERSPAARAAQPETLGSHRMKLDRSLATVPPHINGIVFANELLDALPVHPVVMTDAGLREVYVDVDGDGAHPFVERLGPPSQRVRDHMARFGIQLESGWRAEVSPAAVEWVERVSACLDCGFLVLIDYGHGAAELYSPTHATGTLATYDRHVVQTGHDPESTRVPWLEAPGAVDITAHVDLTAVQAAAEETGLDTLGIVDQTYFLLGLGAAEWPEPEDHVAALKRRLALKTLLVPGGLGSTHKVMIFGKNVGSPRLGGCSFSARAT